MDMGAIVGVEVQACVFGETTWQERINSRDYAEQVLK